MRIRFVAMATARARHYQAGGADAYGMAPERRISDGEDVPCRHCLRRVAAGRAYLVLAHRPFPARQPYAETGPVFLCAEPCERAPDTDVMPEIFRASTEWLLRGYGHDDRIVDGTGAVTPKKDVCTRAHALLSRDDVAYLHLRSARNNCYQVRIDRT